MPSCSFFITRQPAPRFGNIRKVMKDREMDENGMPSEIDFSKATRGLHHIPPDAKVLMPVSIEKTVWEYFSGKAEQRGIALGPSNRSPKTRYSDQRGAEIKNFMRRLLCRLPGDLS